MCVWHRHRVSVSSFDSFASIMKEESRDNLVHTTELCFQSSSPIFNTCWTKACWGIQQFLKQTKLYGVPKWYLYSMSYLCFRGPELRRLLLKMRMNLRAFLCVTSYSKCCYVLWLLVITSLLICLSWIWNYGKNRLWFAILYFVIIFNIVVWK